MNSKLIEYVNITTKYLLGLFVCLIVALYLGTQSIVLSMCLSLILTLVVFLVLRIYLLRNTRSVFSPLLSNFTVFDDKGTIIFEDDESWACGLIWYSGLKLYCMLSVKEEGITIKLPSYSKNKLFLIEWELVESIEYENESVDNECATAELVLNVLGLKAVRIPWRTSFDDFLDHDN